MPTNRVYVPPAEQTIRSETVLEAGCHRVEIATFCVKTTVYNLGVGSETIAQQKSRATDIVAHRLFLSYVLAK